jgi:hypothetical protein
MVRWRRERRRFAGGDGIPAEPQMPAVALVDPTSEIVEIVRRFDITFGRIDQNHAADVRHIQVGKHTDNVAARGVEHENVGSPDTEPLRSALCSSSAKRLSLLGSGPGPLNPAPARA